MYSHGKKVDTSSIAVVYTGTRELRAKLKQIVDGDAVVVVGNRWSPRAVLLPVPPSAGYDAHDLGSRITKLRVRFAAALARIDS
jgi:hypothetical protein